MIFNEHANLIDRHAFLSPSNYHWLNYSDEKLDGTYLRMQATQRGTKLHALAKECIELGVKLPRSNKTLNMYINDAIGFKMKPEVPLYYSENCFGTVDAISFKKDFLRVHDLKTGVSATSMKQLLTYAALFCLEYRIDPNKIKIELRIYQCDEIAIEIPDPVMVLNIMAIIKSHNKRIEMLKIGD